MDTRILMLVAASALVAVPALAQNTAPATTTGQNAANEGGSENAAIDSDQPAAQSDAAAGAVVEGEATTPGNSTIGNAAETPRGATPKGSMTRSPRKDANQGESGRWKHAQTGNFDASLGRMTLPAGTEHRRFAVTRNARVPARECSIGFGTSPRGLRCMPGMGI